MKLWAILAGQHLDSSVDVRDDAVVVLQLLSPTWASTTWNQNADYGQGAMWVREANIWRPINLRSSQNM